MADILMVRNGVLTVAVASMLLASCGGSSEDTQIQHATEQRRAPLALTAMTSGCSSFYAARPTFLLPEDLKLDNIQALTKPALGVVVQEPNFNTCLTRASDFTLLPAAPNGTFSTFARTDYSRRQAFNSDGTRYVIYESQGFWNIYNTSTRAFIKRLNGPAGDAELHWDPQDPDLLYYLGGSPQNKLYSIRVSTNTSTLVRDLQSDIAVWPGTTIANTGAEGSPSSDGRYWCFMAVIPGNPDQAKGIFVYDKTTNSVVGRTAWADVIPNNVSMSPSGKWCVVATNTSTYAHTRAFSRDFSFQRLIDPAIGHSDLAIAANGNDVYVGSNNSNTLFMVDLETGERTDLFNFDVPGTGTTTAYHVSGRSFERPGWTLVSTYFNRGSATPGTDDTGIRNWAHRKVYALQLKRGPSVRNIAFNRGNYPFGVGSYYFTEPHATASRDFTKLLFNSNWSSSAIDVDAYMVEIPDGSLTVGATGELNPAVVSANLVNYSGALQVRTSAAATCKFDAAAGKTFANMSETMTSSANGTLHTRPSFPVSSTVDTQIYVGCQSNSTSRVVEIPVILQAALPGTEVVTVHAAGTVAGGVWPLMELRINGQLIQSLSINNPAITSYAFSVPALRAGDKIDLVYTNDATIGSEDRNLYVQSVVTTAGTLGPLNPGVIIDRGSGASATDGLDIYSGGQFGGWIPWNAAMRFVRPVAGTTSIVVRARATLVANVGAEMQVFHKGAMIGSLRINSTQFQNYAFPSTAIAAGDKVDVVFINDAAANGEDRNLIVESVIAGSFTLLPSASTSVLDRGDGIAAFDGVNVQAAAPLGGWIPWNAALRMIAQ